MNQPWSFARMKRKHSGSLSGREGIKYYGLWIYLFDNKIIETATYYANVNAAGFSYIWATQDLTSNDAPPIRLHYPNDQLGFQKYISTTDAHMIKSDGWYYPLREIISQCSLQNRLITEEEYNNGKTLSILQK